MTPKQIELMLRAQTTTWIFMKGAGDYGALRALYDSGYVESPQSMLASDITESGWKALAEHFPRLKVETISGDRYIVAKGGRVIAKMLPGVEEDALRSA